MDRIIPKSIRWRLPLSYAGIALLATVSLGVVLLAMLQTYYAQRERLYLLGNAAGIASVMGDLVTEELPPAALQAQLANLAFLSQTRVRLVERAGWVVADSGPVEAQRQVAALSLQVQVEGPGLSQAVTQTVGGPGGTRYTSVIVVEDSLAGTNTEIRKTEEFEVVGPGADDGAGEPLPTPVPPTPTGGPAEAAAQSVPPGGGIGADGGLVSLVPAIGTQWGFGLGGEISTGGRRSNEVVQHPIHDRDGAVRGHIELSEGPAYGREIVESVARAWLVATGVAVLLAAAAGWLASRRITTPLVALAGVTSRMGSGEFSARAEVTRDDELGHLAHSFNEMAQHVEQTVTTLRRFVADAAHELQTPLTALRSNLELAAGNGSAHEYIARAQAQADRLDGLARSLLDLSWLQTNGTAAAHTPVELTLLLRACSEPYASMAEQAGLTFALELPEGPVWVQGSANQLRHAVGNLLDNAIKFTAEGGSVRAGVQEAGGWADLWVEDTGIGVPADELPLLFSRFHRARNAAAYPGNGLGLAIVRAIAEGHGGRVTAEGRAAGMIFTLRLPLGASVTR
ncbi:MAG TPA: HAMP domain-containing sensor histidine kinase [Lacipirellulaceae bacterium]|nr:HAMP domain-containing sensor histidine kinase [Lacipirellulaceae bacterium]